MSEFLLAATNFVMDLRHILEAFVLEMPIVFVVWMAFVGGCVGSFINVVVYRWPAGKSIVFPPSHCPKCGTPIRSSDNLPVVGWLLLRGKCRECRLPIAVRYPFVEFTHAVLFGVLGALTIWHLSPESNLLVELARLVFYANAASCLVAVGLIDLDGHPVPRRLLIYLFLSIVVPTVWQSAPSWATFGGCSVWGIERLAGVVSVLLLRRFVEPSKLWNLLLIGGFSGFVTSTWWANTMGMGISIVLTGYLRNKKSAVNLSPGMVAAFISCLILLVEYAIGPRIL